MAKTRSKPDTINQRISFKPEDNDRLTELQKHLEKIYQLPVSKTSTVNHAVKLALEHYKSA